MARGRRLRTAPVVTLSRTLDQGTAARQLPAETVTEILEYLPLEDLWCAAAASRMFYAAAWRAGLYIHRKIIWAKRAGCDADLAVLRAVVEHVLGNGLRLSFSFALDVSDRWNLAERNSFHENITPALLEMLLIVTSALPVIVFLDLHITGHCMGPMVDDALHHPAPYLTELKLSLSSKAGPYAVSSNIFTGVAPHLRQVALTDVHLGLGAISAFSHVLSAEIVYERVHSNVEFARHFPRLRLLRFHANKWYAPPAASLKLDGLSLRKLVIKDGEYLSARASMDSSIADNVANVEHELCGSIAWLEPLWHRQDEDMLSVRLSHFLSVRPDSMSIFIVPEHRRWRRTFRLCKWAPRAFVCPIQTMPGLRERLAYLRLSNIHLTALLQCQSLDLGALREMQIDLESRGPRPEMLWPPDWLWTYGWQHDTISFNFRDADISSPTFDKESYAYLHCCNLEVLRLFALDKAMRVESLEAAFLGRALAQVPRAKKEKAALELIGVDFNKPLARKLLGLTFSCVRKRDFAGRNSPVDYDAGMWNDDT